MKMNTKCNSNTIFTIKSKKKKRVKRVGAGYMFLVLLSTLVLFGCQERGNIQNEDLAVDVVSVNETDSASANDTSSDTKGENSGVNVIASEDMDSSTPESILLDDFLDTLSSNYSLINGMNESSLPTGMSVEVASGVNKDVLFANGTPINILSTKADVDGMVWDTVVQYALGNNLDSDNKGYGAIVTWQEGSKTKYVYVSNMVEIYGGSYKSDLHSNVYITIDGENYRNAYPNISFLYGGCLEGDLVGNVDISVNQGRPMFLIGGGHNGSVFGNVSICYDKNSWSMDIIGGGYADAIQKDSLALCYGDISIVMSTAESSSDSNCLIGGGLAFTYDDYTAVADVLGNVNISIEGQSFKEVTGGGVAIRTNDTAAMPICNVFGDSSIDINNCRIIKDGLLCESGMAKDGLAMVFGQCQITDTRLVIDRKAQGRVNYYNILKSDKYYGSPITKAYESVNKADRYVDYEPQKGDDVLDKVARIGFEGSDITYAIVVSYVDNKYKLSLYNYSNDFFTTKEASASMGIYQNIKDVQGINKRYKEEYFNDILVGDIAEYIETTRDIELYTAENYDPDNVKEYTVIYPDMSSYLQWNGSN